ncbi:MAG TPA: flavodoxin domain-containing protein [Anaerolineales bacterium]|nr:flavodoxin domain-containing protein [Anaerolineales bacterium]
MPKQTLSRRDFLKITGITLGTSAVACSGLAALATYSPSVTFAESAYGEQNMSKRILVTYASKRGSTGEVAEAIGKTLATTGARVDVLPLKKITDLSGYQAVLIGSAIRVAKWLPEAVDFVSENRAVLQRVPTAYFTVCMTLAEDTPANRTRAAGFLEPVRAMLAPAAEGYFAGKVDFKRLSFIEGTMLKAKGGIEGDFRDWDKITNWAQSTYAQIYE